MAQAEGTGVHAPPPHPAPHAALPSCTRYNKPVTATEARPRVPGAVLTGPQARGRAQEPFSGPGFQPGSTGGAALRGRVLNVRGNQSELQGVSVRTELKCRTPSCHPGIWRTACWCQENPAHLPSEVLGVKQLASEFLHLSPCLFGPGSCSVPHPTDICPSIP